MWLSGCRLPSGFVRTMTALPQKAADLRRRRDRQPCHERGHVHIFTFRNSVPGRDRELDASSPGAPSQPFLRLRLEAEVREPVKMVGCTSFVPMRNLRVVSGVHLIGDLILDLGKSCTIN